jgi:Immunoglobulin domain
MPTVYWRRQGNDRILSTQKSLQIASVTESDFTSFTCSGASVGYDTVSRNVYILRKGPPTILSPTHQSARYGEMATIECLVRSVPPPTDIIWTKNGQNIDFTSMPRSAIIILCVTNSVECKNNA